MAVPLFFIICALTLFTCSGGIPPFDKISYRPDMRVKNFVSSTYHRGKLVWEMTAEDISYYFSENRGIAQKIVLNYYKKGKPAARVHADKAIIDTESKNIELRGSVDAVSLRGSRLETSQIYWDHKSRTFTTDERVRIRRSNGDVIEGIGLRANYDLEDYEIKKGVTATTTTRRAGMKKRRGGR